MKLSQRKLGWEEESSLRSPSLVLSFAAFFFFSISLFLDIPAALYSLLREGSNNWDRWRCGSQEGFGQEVEGGHSGAPLLCGQPPPPKGCGATHLGQQCDNIRAAPNQR